MIGDKITKISVDEKNHKYSVEIENGEIFVGYKALNMIRVRKAIKLNGKEYLEPFIQPKPVEIDRSTID